MINDFALACAIDESPAYFTYDKQTMLIIQSAQDAKAGTGSFQYIEPFIEALISHESIHVVIKKFEGAEISDSLDDVEVVVEHRGAKFQVTLNNMLFARDNSGIVTSE
jgi:arginine deiminase